MKSIICTLLFTAASCFATAGDTIIHKGRVLSTGSSFGPSSAEQFQEVYIIPKILMQKQKEIDARTEPLLLDIPSAIAAVRQNISAAPDSVVILSAKLHNFTWNTVSPRQNFLKGVFYYTVEFRTPEGIYEYVILMDGTVIKPKSQIIK